MGKRLTASERTAKCLAYAAWIESLKQTYGAPYAAFLSDVVEHIAETRAVRQRHMPMERVSWEQARDLVLKAPRGDKTFADVKAAEFGNGLDQGSIFSHVGQMAAYVKWYRGQFGQAPDALPQGWSMARCLPVIDDPSACEREKALCRPEKKWKSAPVRATFDQDGQGLLPGIL